MSDPNELWYPTAADVLQLHDDIIREDAAATPGVENEDRVQFALDYVQHGHFGRVPETIHEKAFHLLRLLASNHWFADGNKRTALSSTALFYVVNGYELDYGEDIRAMLKLFSVRESLVDEDVGPEYLAEQTAVVDWSTGGIVNSHGVEYGNDDGN
jgi:death-on-curing protein